MNNFIQKEYWNKVADVKEFPTPFKIEEFNKYVLKEEKVLDVGCGYGRTLNELYKQGFKNLTGIDYSKEMIKRGLKLYPYLNILENNGDYIPFPDNKFDSVILISVLTSNYNDEEQENLISEINRVLKNEGILYMADFLINNDKRNLDRYKLYKNKYGIYGVFELPEGAILRHHTKKHIMKLTKHFNGLLYKELKYKTMNGHISNGFYYILRKKTKI